MNTPGHPTRQTFTVSFASNGLTATVDLGPNPWKKVFVDAQAMGAKWSVYCSDDATTYGTLQERVQTASVQWQAITIPSSVSGGWAPIDVNARYLQFVATATIANGQSSYLICTNQ